MRIREKKEDVSRNEVMDGGEAVRKGSWRKFCTDKEPSKWLHTILHENMGKTNNNLIWKLLVREGVN